MDRTHKGAGYFMLAHRDTALCHDPARITDYKAAIVHGVLLNNKLVIADHMVTNAPNFRIAYNTDANFRRVICSGLIDIAYFDRLANEGPHFSLKQLREFYADMEGPGHPIFHKNLPDRFRTSEHDYELAAIESAAGRILTSSQLRDPLFTHFVLDQMDQDFLKEPLGEMYSTYERAFARMRADVAASDHPVFGIIHFDPEHSSKRQRTIFDYMADTYQGRVSGLSVKRFVKKYGEVIARTHRAMLVRAESQILQARPVLPNDLKEYRRLVLPTSKDGIMDKHESEAVRFPIDLTALTRPAIASLSISHIRECRKMGEGYFSLLDNLDSVTSAREAGDTIKNYIRSINNYLDTLPLSAAQRSGKLSGLVEIIYGRLADDEWRAAGIALVATISAYEVTTLYSFIAGAITAAAAGVTGKRISPSLRSLAERKLAHNQRVADGIRAAIIKLPEVGSLTQYEL